MDIKKMKEGSIFGPSKQQINNTKRKENKIKAMDARARRANVKIISELNKNKPKSEPLPVFPKLVYGKSNKEVLPIRKIIK